MDSSLSRQTISSLSIIPGQPSHRLTESDRKGDIVGRYVDAAGIAHGFIARVRGTPPANRRVLATKANIPGRWPLHSTRRPRRGEVQCRRAELSIGGPKIIYGDAVHYEPTLIST